MTVKEKIKELSEKAKFKTTENIAFAGYVLYFWNPEHLECDLKPLPSIAPTCRIKGTNEIYQLGKPAMFLNGKPLFVVVRDVPYSIELQLESKSKVISKLKEKGYTSSEIDAKIHSIYTNQIFRSKRLSKTDFIIFILSIITSVLLTSLFFIGGS